VEDSPRVAYMQLAFVTFSAASGALPVWRGREMQPDDMSIHSRGERLHQSMSGPSVWNVIAMDPAKIERYGRALSGKPFCLPLEGLTLQPSPRLVARARRLHAQICRVPETSPSSCLIQILDVGRSPTEILIGDPRRMKTSNTCTPPVWERAKPNSREGAGFATSSLGDFGRFKRAAQTRWHLAHSERVDPAICAGGRQPFAAGDEILGPLADDNYVHLGPDYACLITHGERWRGAARKGVIGSRGAERS
jgi:hypothetical protein